MNSSDLSPDELRAMPIDLVGAVGLVQVNRGGTAHVAQDIARIDHDTELGSVLVRLKHAGDRTLGNRAVWLLVAWVREQRAFRNWKIRPGSNDLVEAFVRQALAEWLHPVCQVCAGRQVLGMDRGEIRERRIKCIPCGATGRRFLRHSNGQLSAVRQSCPDCRTFGWTIKRKVVSTKPKTCHACSGTGVHRVSDAERALSMRLDQNGYRKHWAKRFGWIAARLDALEDTERRGLQVQLGTG